MKAIMILSLTGMVVLSSPVHLAAQTDTARAPENCVIYRQKGKPLKVVRFNRISNGIIEYESDGSLHDLKVETVDHITCGSRIYRIVNDTLNVVAKFKNAPAYGQTKFPKEDSTIQHNFQSTDTLFTYDPSIDYTTLARKDADRQYSVAGGFVVGLLTTPFIIVPPLIAAIPPSPSQKYNPNRHLYNTVPEYRVAYKKRAHGKKAFGVVIGVGTALIMLAALSN